MRQWRKTTDMVQPADGGDAVESWALFENGALVTQYDLTVRRYKPVDMRRLKPGALDELRAYSAGLADAVRALYGRGAPVVRVGYCPCCTAPANGAVEHLRVFDVPYVRCAQCGHVFVWAQPVREALEAMFRDSEELAATYVDRDACEERLVQVVGPKLKWLRNLYADWHGRFPRSVLDVGAGGGHFVEMARRAGMISGGYELSVASRGFARAAFGLDLDGSDFLAPGRPVEPVDCVTFWGVLEYAPDPAAFLRAARDRLGPQGMVVLEVPRYDCLGTAILRVFPDTVYRHTEPSSHIHCFSDASVATLLHEAGLRPVAAWYFGMDVHELLTQQAMALGDPGFVDRFGHLVPHLQRVLDEHGCCDDMILAAISQ